MILDTYVLPVLLQQGDEEVDGHLNVLEELLLLHVAVADGHTHAQHLLQLELDGRLRLRYLHCSDNKNNKS